MRWRRLDLHRPVIQAALAGHTADTTPGQRKCRECGATLQQGQAFCTSCGASLAELSAAEAAAETAFVQTAPKSPRVLERARSAAALPMLWWMSTQPV